MSFIPLKCTQCGAALPASVNGESVRCEYCGTYFYNEPPQAGGARRGPSATGAASSDMEYIKQLIIDGEKVKAIKLVREQKGLGLFEAKTLVDKMERELIPQ